MPLPVYELAIEEVAYAMGVLGGTDAATGFLLASLGERPRLETEGRLLAASHALVARGYLDFDMATGETWLIGGLDKVVKSIVESDYTLRCSRAQTGQEAIMTLYSAGDHFVLHQLYRGVVSRLKHVTDRAAVQELCLDFFDLPTDVGHVEKSLADLHVDLVETLRQQAHELSSDLIASRLMDQGLSQNEAQILAIDFRQQDYRGSIIRIEEQNKQAVSNRGFLILKAGQRSWMFEMDPHNPSILRLFAGNATGFHNLLSHLIT